MLLFSRIMKVQQIDCDAAGLHTCPNLNLPVFTQRIAIGNTTLRTSAVRHPAAGLHRQRGEHCGRRLLPAVRAGGHRFERGAGASAGQSTTLVEGYFAMPDINFLSFPGSGGGYYVRFLF